MANTGPANHRVGRVVHGDGSGGCHSFAAGVLRWRLAISFPPSSSTSLVQFRCSSYSLLIIILPDCKAFISGTTPRKRSPQEANYPDKKRRCQEPATHIPTPPLSTSLAYKKIPEAPRRAKGQVKARRNQNLNLSSGPTRVFPPTTRPKASVVVNLILWSTIG